MASKLPTPRMQLRWKESKDTGYQWECHYELVILLDEYDVRREVYKNGRELKRKLPRELAIPMKTPSLRNSSKPANSKQAEHATIGEKENLC